MSQNHWLANAIRIIEADYNRSADTHLIKLDMPAFPDIDIYLKDESTHPTGSLKHRLARSLFLYALCNGWIKEGMPIIEASSGSTAISEAYFARLLGLPFIAVVPVGTAPKKMAQISFYGGQCYQVAATDLCQAAADMAKEMNGHFMDQFTYAERATDWRGNNNIAESIFTQMNVERFSKPSWIVVSAGTGGTSATIGRYLRHQQWWQQPSQLCVVDPENSVFYDYYQSGDASLTIQQGSRIEGIGRPRVEPSFEAAVIDKMLKVEDNESLAAAHFLSAKLGRLVGGSTGTNFVGVLALAEEMQQRGEQGSIVTLICDGGDRYQESYFDHDWLREKGYEVPERVASMQSIYG
ncbi:PLP-dependent cysteine synthase family protein [Neptunomonas japonica]|uniref:L-cysteine desulfhydrase Cds1 n=1 Tax=Neptunomonas japonica JAMM 1380 TaxID=1441457 RepID=A0A7R6SXX5_9GAMM|nr:PLP-dependent cysteine synthase family protein [Neptunomonas japonica]BBB31290.1 cysteine synthase A [Neptunomonas japonica JAMM 1380]